MFQTSISAAALSAGDAVLSQAKFDVKISGPLMQSGNVNVAATRPLRNAGSATSLFKCFMFEIYRAVSVSKIFNYQALRRYSQKPAVRGLVIFHERVSAVLNSDIVT